MQIKTPLGFLIVSIPAWDHQCRILRSPSKGQRQKQPPGPPWSSIWAVFKNSTHSWHFTMFLSRGWGSFQGKPRFDSLSGIHSIRVSSCLAQKWWVCPQQISSQPSPPTPHFSCPLWTHSSSFLAGRHSRAEIQSLWKIDLGETDLEMLNESLIRCSVQKALY